MHQPEQFHVAELPPTPEDRETKGDQEAVKT